MQEDRGVLHSGELAVAAAGTQVLPQQPEAMAGAASRIRAGVDTDEDEVGGVDYFVHDVVDEGGEVDGHIRTMRIKYNNNKSFINTTSLIISNIINTNIAINFNITICIIVFR